MKQASPLMMCFAALLCAAGCFNSSSPADAAASSDAARCTSLVASDVLVQPTDSGSTSAPGTTGGDLVGGTYHLDSTTYYPANYCTPASLATALLIQPLSPTTGSIETVTTDSAGGRVDEVVRYTISGAQLFLRLDCVSPDSSGLRGTAAVIPYTFDGGALLLANDNSTCGVSVDRYVINGG